MGRSQVEAQAENDCGVYVMAAARAFANMRPCSHRPPDVFKEVAAAAAAAAAVLLCYWCALLLQQQQQQQR